MKEIVEYKIEITFEFIVPPDIINDESSQVVYYFFILYTYMYSVTTF